MTDKPTLPNWVLIEAAKRSDWDCYTVEELRQDYENNEASCYRALCDMIERYEQPPVDRKVLCAQEALLGCFVPASIETIESAIVRAITLWESGYGK